MSTPVKLAGFVTAIAAVFALALVAGRAAGPVADQASDPHAAGGHSSEPSPAEPSPGEQIPGEQIPGGLMVSQNGYTLSLAEPATVANAGRRPVRFTIIAPDGSPVTEYDVAHEKRLHLIAVRRDVTGFQHVHPTLDTDTGVWSTDLDLTPGTWRLFADFKATGAEALTLGTDLEVAGAFEPATPAAENRTATVGEYTVTLEGRLSAGTDAKLTLRVSKDGQPVTDLQPYLGAYGHLVALRGGDLAYLHVHPDGTPGDGTTTPGPDVVFYAAVPSAGRYHLFLDFQHEGVVRTAAFTVTAGAATHGEHSPADPTPSPTGTPADHGSHSGH